MLRRDLSTARIALAEEKAGREVAEHALRQLEAQRKQRRSIW
jgi:hypothetical protein